MNIDKIKLGKDKSVDLFSDIAKEAAEHIKSSKRNKSTQIRKFYDELLLWNNKVNVPSKTIQEREQKYEELAPFIKMLKAKVAYAEGREHIDNKFKNVFDKCIDEVHSFETLKDAKLFLEAVIAYSKLHELKEY